MSSGPCGDVEQVTGGMGLQAPKLVDQGLADRPKEECANDVRVNDIRDGVASLGEPTDVVPQRLTGLLLATLKVLGVSRADIRPLEISDEDPLEISPVADAIGREEFEPCSNMLPHIDGEILNDEVVIIHSFGSVGEPNVFDPYTGVRFLGVSSDVGGWLEALWEQRHLDAMTKGPWPQAI